MLHTINFLSKWLILILTLLWATGLVQAQADVASLIITHIQATALENGQVQVLTLVSALDETGQPVTGLTAPDFTLSENGAPIPADQLTVTAPTQPFTVTLLIDTSQAMTRPAPDGVRAIDSAKEAVIRFIEALGDGDHVAVYEYSSGLSLAQDFTLDHNLAIDRGVVPLDARETQAACLYDSLPVVIDLLAPASSGQNVVIVITGSAPPATEACAGGTLEDTVELATTAASRIPIFSVSFGPQVNQDELARLARLTGGQSLSAPNSADVAKLLSQISAQLRQQYEISYATQADSGLAKITVQENSSGQSDSRQVFIPKVIEPTPTPLPQFTISLAVQLVENKLQLAVEAPPDVNLTQTALFINGQLVQQKTAPPWDIYEVDILELGSGKHNFRVEATADTGVTTQAEREVDLTIPPTPAPTPTPLPTPTPTTPPTGLAAIFGDKPNSLIPIVLIGGGLIILLAIALALIAYFLFSGRRQPAILVNLPPAVPPPPPPMVTTDFGDEPFAGRTFDSIEAVDQKARLVVVEGHQALANSNYNLDKPELKLGRNTPKEATNDIPVQDKEVSRSHARIIYRERQFFIQDQGSSTGTMVNAKRISPFQDVRLQNGDEIGLGPRIKLRFELVSPPRARPDESSQGGLATTDPNDDADRTIFNL